MNTDKNTARTELTTHQKHVAALHEQSRGLDARIRAFGAAETAAQPAIDRVSALRAQRNELLAEVAVGDAGEDAIDDADRQLSDAQELARAAQRACEIARAGTARLQAERDLIAGQIAAASKHTEGLSYHAAVALAQSKLAAYRAAVEGMGAALADLQGACAAVDACANPRAIPTRPWVSGGLGPTTFDAPIPELPGLDPKAWSFSIAAQVATATAAALAELAG